MVNSKCLRLSLALVLLFSLFGCSSHKNVTNSSSPELAEAVLRYENTLKHDFNFDCLQSKVKYTYNGKSLNGKLNVEQGKRLCMTVTLMGIELARVEANRDSVTVAVKANKTYATASIAEVAGKLGLENEARYEVLEALLLGRMFVPGKGIAQPSHFRSFAWDVKQTDMQATFNANHYQLAYLLNAQNELTSTEVRVASRNLTCTCSYSGHQSVAGAKGATADAALLPVSDQFVLNAPGHNISAQIALSSPALSNKGWTSFVPTSSYRKVSFSDLMQMAKSLIP